MKYLFWNTNKNIAINHLLDKLIRELCCDIVVLAEYNDDPNDLLKMLSSNHFNLNRLPIIGCPRIEILCP